MPYIAKVSDASGSWQVTELRLATNGLNDVGQAERAEWRLVIDNRPVVDNYTQVLIPQTLNVNEDGSEATIIWQAVDTPAAWGKMRLRDYALQCSTTKANAGLMLPNGIQLSTTGEQTGMVVAAIVALERGWLTEPLLFQALNGEWVTLSLSALQAAGAAIAQFRQGIYQTRKAVYDAIDAGTIVSTAQVDAAI
jgi:hypothetical protein